LWSKRRKKDENIQTTNNDAYNKKNCVGNKSEKRVIVRLRRIARGRDRLDTDKKTRKTKRDEEQERNILFLWK
jgi:hypothetical protein